MQRRAFLSSAVAAGMAVAAGRAWGGPSGFTLTFLGSLSGPGASFAQDALDGLSLGLKDLGFRLANQEVRLVVEDDGGRPGQALYAARRLVNGPEQSDVVITALWPSALVQAVPVFAGARTFVINLGQAPQSLAEEGCSSWLFDLAGEEDGVHEAAGIAMTADQIKRVQVVGQDRAATDQAVKALARTFQGEVVGVERVADGVVTFTKTVATVTDLGAAKGAAAVYTVLGGGQGAAFMRAVGAVPGVKVYAPWYGFERSFLPSMGDGAIGATVIGTWSAEFDQPANHRLVSGYETEYGRLPTTWSSHGYDAIALLDAAAKQTKPKQGDADTFRSLLRHAEFASTRGGVKFNSNQFPVLTYWRMMVGRDAKGRLIREAKGPLVKDWRSRAVACPMRWDDKPPAAPPVKKKG